MRQSVSGDPTPSHGVCLHFDFAGDFLAFIFVSATCHMPPALGHLASPCATVCCVWHANFTASIEGHVSCGFRFWPSVVVWLAYFQVGQQSTRTVLAFFSALFSFFFFGYKFVFHLKFMTTIASKCLSVCLGLLPLPLSVRSIKITL